MSGWVNWDAMWRVLVLGLAFGVGVVGLFSLAIVGIDSESNGRRPLARPGARRDLPRGLRRGHRLRHLGDARQVAIMGPMAPPRRDDLDALVNAVAELRARVAPMILARQEGRRQGATEGERVTTPQHLTLLALADGPRSVSEVAAETGVAVSTATRMLQSLMRVEWVQPATPAAGEDRRRRPVELTPEGRRVLEQADEVMRARVRRLLEVLDEEERAAVVAGLAAFARALQADDERGSDLLAAASSASSS